MTAFLRVNGIIARVLRDQASTSIEEIGDTDRAVDGSELASRRALKSVFSMTLGQFAPRTAIAWRDLLLGKGHSFSFDSHLYSAKGLPPTTIGSGVAQAATTPKFGAGVLSMPATRTITYTALPGATFYTVAYWAKVGAGNWTHYVTTGSSFWTNGVAAGSDPHIGVAGSVVTVTADGVDTTLIDDLVILPFKAPTDWPAQMYSYGNTDGQPFSDLHRLKIDGLLNDDNIGTKTVVGRGVSVKPMQAAISGTRYANVSEVQVELAEV